MPKYTLIIISGHAATGKSTLAKRISEELNISLISADSIKEIMWDTLGHEFDFEFSDKLGRTAFELLYYFIDSALSKGTSLIVEAHFDPERNNERINKLKEKYKVNLLQVYCHCETEALKKRFKDRTKKESYHKGHKHIIDLYGEEQILHNLEIKNKRLDINGETYDLDTTNPENIDYEKLFEFIRSGMRK